MLLLIGVVLLEYPLEPQAVPVNNMGGTVSTIEAVQVNSPILSQHFDIEWSSSVSGTMQYGVCSNIPNAPSGLSSCSQSGSGSGTSGTLTFTATNGEFVVLFFSGTGGSATAKTTIPTAGIVLVVVGVILLVAGVALSSKPKTATPEPGPTPPTPPAQGSPPPSSK